MQKELGAKSITAEVKEIYADEEIKEIMLKNGDTLKTRERSFLQQEQFIRLWE